MMKANEPLLKMKQAAFLLGYSSQGMRKLIERSKRRLQGYPVDGPTIKFFQPRPGDEIKFRLEWIWSYVDACTHDPESVPLRTLAPKAKHAKKSRRSRSETRRMSANGFDPTLLRA